MTHDRHDDTHQAAGQRTGCLDAEAALSEFMTIGPSGEVVFHDVDRLHAQIKAVHRDEWSHLVAAFDLEPDAFHVAYEYLRCHPIFWRPHVKAAHLALSAADIAECELPDPETADGTVEDTDGWHSINVDVVRVDPATSSISDDPSANTRTEVWMEAGPWLWPRFEDPSTRWQYPVAGMAAHDVALDCGAGTFEEATVALARGVRVRYGDDRALIYSPRPYAGWGDEPTDDPPADQRNDEPATSAGASDPRA